MRKCRLRLPEYRIAPCQALKGGCHGELQHREKVIAEAALMRNQVFVEVSCLLVDSARAFEIGCYPSCSLLEADLILPFKHLQQIVYPMQGIRLILLEHPFLHCQCFAMILQRLCFKAATSQAHCQQTVRAGNLLMRGAEDVEVCIKSLLGVSLGALKVFEPNQAPADEVVASRYAKVHFLLEECAMLFELEQDRKSDQTTVSCSVTLSLSDPTSRSLGCSQIVDSTSSVES